MASSIVASLPKASSIITPGGSCWRPNKCVNYFTSSYAIWEKGGKSSKKNCLVAFPRCNLKHHYEGIIRGSKGDKFEKKYFVNVTSTHSDGSELQAHESKSILESIKHTLDVLLKFYRPQASIPLMLAVFSMSFIAVDKVSDISPRFFIGLLQYLAAMFIMQNYNVGINQIADHEIDKINKPYLPLASGELSPRNATMIVALSLFMSLGFGWIIGSRPLLWALFACSFLSTAYSIDLPLLRWKNSTVLAVLYALGYTIIGLNLGPFLHMKTHVLHKAIFTYPRPLIFSIVMQTFFVTVIQLLKDISDIEGDIAGGNQTLAIRLGSKPVFWFCISLLEIGYGTAIIIGATSIFQWSRIFTVLTHAILALFLWDQAKNVDIENKSSIEPFYTNIFKYLAVEYVLIPFVR